MRIESSSLASQKNKRNSMSVDNKRKNNRQNLMMFCSVFAVLLLIFLGLARIMSPDVDISLGDDTQIQEQDENYRRTVDSRLKLLQQDDDMNLSEHDRDELLIEDDGIVSIPKIEEKTMLKLEDEEPIATEIGKVDNNSRTRESASDNAHLKHEESDLPAIRQIKSEESGSQSSAPTPTNNKMYRVYVGMYSNQAQAEVAKGILNDSGLGVTPSVKQTPGGYTLQVGAFSSKESATALANKLLINNYPARVNAD